MIKEIATAVLTAGTLFAVPGAANSADVFTPDDAYSAGTVAPAKVNFSGFYIGGAIGYGNANHDLSVRDYFKDFCVDRDRAADPEFDPFEDRYRRHGPKVRSGTLENKNLRFDPEAPFASCADVEGKRDIEAGDLETFAGDSREVANLDGVNSTGVVGDLRIGYDQQVGRFVLGVFGTYGFSGMEASGSVIGAHGNAVTDFSLERGDDWSIGARAGALVNDRTLLYILAAYTETEYTFSGDYKGEAFSNGTTFSGYTVGGGIEFAINQNLFLGLEGTHTFYDGEVIFDSYDPATNVGTLIHDDLGETKIMGTLKLKLNSFN